MSAIWGAVSLEGKALPARLSAKMKQPYEACVIDRFAEHRAKGVYLGCGIQYFTPEAKGERLPIADEAGNAFTADIMLDNREELLGKLGLADKAGQMADGDIAFAMFSQYGTACLNELLGAYSFAYCSGRDNRVYLVSDAVGNRCLYYRVEKGVLYFSTLIAPLLQAAGCEGPNERWLTDFLAMDNFGAMTEYEETPYLGIYKLRPGEWAAFSAGETKKEQYWRPNTAYLRLENDEAYARRLKEVLGQSVGAVLRGEKTSIFLSGGLDSTAVACFAARQLRDKGQALYAYTSVPEEGFKPKAGQAVVEDESENVLSTKAYLEAQGCRLEWSKIQLAGQNAWDGRRKEAKILEVPYKSMQNILWLAEGMALARQTGSRVVLGGGYGNISISASGVDLYLFALLAERRYVSFLRQCRAFGRAAGRPFLSRARLTLGLIRDYFWKNRAEKQAQSLFGEAFVRQEKLAQYQTEARFRRAAGEIAAGARSYEKRQALVQNNLIFSTKGEVSTKHSLYSGAILRDPTMDKRLIEFCLRLPPGQTVRDGISRRLVRVYLADMLPPHVARPGSFGAQSADVLYRLEKQWPRIYGELAAVFDQNRESPIADGARACRALEKYAAGLEGARQFSIMRLCYTALALEFAGQWNEQNPSNTFVRIIDSSGERE